MSSDCLFMVRFNDRQKLLDAVSEFDSVSQIRNWYAVDGYYGLVIQATGDIEQTASRVAALDGFNEMARCLCSDNTSMPSELSPDETHSLLFMEIDPSHRDNLCSEISNVDSVSHCIKGEGDFNLVAVVSADNFNEIDFTIKESIQPMAGILRFKQDRVIQLGDL